MKSIALQPVLCALILVSAFFQSAPKQAPQEEKSRAETWQRLRSFEDVDLATLGEASYEEFTSLLWDLTHHTPMPGPRVSRFPDDLSYLWNMSSPGGPTRYVVIHPLRPYNLPGDSRASILVFDDAGDVLDQASFSLGQYLWFEEVERIKNSNLGVPLIKVTTKPNLVRNNPDGTHSDLPGFTQYYGLIGDDLALIRFERSGTATRNIFFSTAWIIGPELPKRTAAEWEQALLSTNRLEVLRTLGWLGGRHWNLKTPTVKEKDGSVTPTEDVRQDAELVNSVCNRPVVRARLEELSKSANTWIREAAELALKPHDGGDKNWGIYDDQ